MPNKEHQKNITVKEAISEITSTIIKQKGFNGKDYGLDKLRSMALSVFEVFEVGDVPIERTIFMALNTPSSKKPAAQPETILSATEGNALKSAENKSQTVLIKGKEGEKDKEIVFYKNANIGIKILRALAETSEENPISVSTLVKAVYGDKISSTLAKKIIGSNLVFLQRKLKHDGLIVVKKPVDRKQEGSNRTGDRVLYYLANENDSSKNSAENKETPIILIKDKKIVFHESANTAIKILRALTEASEENPISVSALAKAVYSDNSNKISLLVARKKITTTLLTLQKKLKEYDLIIAKKPTDKKDRRDKRMGDKVLYYLQEVTKNKPPAEIEKRDVFVKYPDLTHQLVMTDQNTKKVSEEQQSGAPVVTRILKEKIDPNFNPLQENEIYVIAKILLHINWSDEKLRDAFGIDVQPLMNSWEIRSLLSRTNIDLENGKINPIFWSESVSSVRSKLLEFAKDRKKYLNLCEKPAQVLLECFESVKIIDNNFLNELLAIKPALPVPARKKKPL